MVKLVRTAFLAGLFGLLAAGGAAYAQYPKKPLRLIIPFPPGGGTDTLGRVVSQKLGDVLKQQVIMDNRPGAGANIGVEIAAKSPPDGHTLLLATISNAISASLYPKLTYDLVRDFAPVTLLATQPMLLTVHPSLPVRSVREFIALAKGTPNQLTYSSAGSGTPTHLAGELFSHLAQIKLLHVPYKGGGPSVIGLVSGEVAISFAGMPSVISHVTSGKLRGLAVSSAHRSPSAPQLPTIAEAGIPGYDVSAWYGLLVPAGTPGDIITKLNAETGKLLKLSDVKQTLDSAGFEVRVTTPEEYGAFTRAEIERWARVVKASGVRPD